MVQNGKKLPWRFHSHHIKRWITTFFSSHKTLFTILWMVGLASVFVWQRNIVDGFYFPPSGAGQGMPRLRSVSFNLTDFGAVGDGRIRSIRTVSAISKLGKKVGGQLKVPAGRWVTAPFNLTSHMTPFLAAILGIDDEKYWPLMPLLPYEKGKEHPLMPLLPYEKGKEHPGP